MNFQAIAYRWAFNASTSTDMMELHGTQQQQQYGSGVALVNQAVKRMYMKKGTYYIIQASFDVIK